MTYLESLDKIHSLLRFGIKPGLERLAILLEKMGNPHKKLKYIHVAGTNGKGSVCSMTASVLNKAGYKTGLYTSPFVVEFGERIQINGKYISKQDLVDMVEKYFPVVEEMAAQGNIITEFEFVTAIAFEWFYEQKCDIVVLETGLGGRFDATNIIDSPIVSVIASISLDHTDILGNSVDEIAMEKCGIIKRESSVVCYPLQIEEAYQVIYETAKQENSKLYVPQADIKILSEDIKGTFFEYKGETVFTPFAGEHQVYNTITSMQVIEVVAGTGFEISKKQMLDGISSARLPARFEVLGEKPYVILDGAHNPQGAKALAEITAKTKICGKKIGIIGMLEDKDYLSALSILVEVFDEVYLVKPENPRAWDLYKAEKILKDNLGKQAKVLSDISETLNEVFNLVNEADMIVCCGSLYLAGEIRPLLIERAKK